MSATVTAKKQIVKFAPRGEENFYETMKRKVDEYFQENNIHTHANSTMIIKTIVMISLYFVPYAFIVSGVVGGHTALFYVLSAIMGIGIVGIGASVMHDSNHGSYSGNKFINSTLGNILNVIGGYARNWRIQHNVLHHTYTNIDGLDEDIDGTKLIRMSPNKPLKPIHKYQHMYAWGLYSLMNIYWVLAKDYKLIFRYEKEGLLKKEKVTLKQAFIELTALRVFYFSYMIVLPLLFSGMAWYHIVGGFVVMQLIAGISLACIFQPAHVMETSDYSLPTPERKMENNWAAHQLLNTTNFAPNSTVTSWFIGGLNYQIEHHLFPHVCHVHYPKISGIVKSIAEKNGLPYNVQPTVYQALKLHARMLRALGRETAPAHV